MAVATVVGLFVLTPHEVAAQGWLVAFAVWSGVSLGSLVLLMIHRLTGGAWGVALGPVLASAAAMTPLLLLAFIPVAFALPSIYPWASDPKVVTSEVAQWYLNRPAFLVRAAITLLGWSVLGVAFARGRGGRSLAAAGLIFFGVTLGMVAIDWFLTVEPNYVSTAFPATIAIQQLLTALALAALLAPATLMNAASSQVGAFLIAVILGVFYLELMTFIVQWYGDLPPKAAWFLRRATPQSLALLIGALTAATIAFAVLLQERNRRNPAVVRLAAAIALVAVLLHTAWLVAPAFDKLTGVLVAALFSLLALSLLTFFVSRLIPFALPVSGPDLPSQPATNPADHLRNGAWRALFNSPDPKVFRPAYAPSPPESEDPAPPEKPDVAMRPVLVSMFGFIAFVVIAGAGLYLFVGKQVATLSSGFAPSAPQPQLQSSGAVEMAKLAAEQRAALAGYAWVDPQQGVVSIPIERAMQAIAARGADALAPLDSSEQPQQQKGGGP